MCLCTCIICDNFQVYKGSESRSMPFCNTMESVSTLWKNLLLRYSPVRIAFVGVNIIQLTCFWFTSAVYISLPYVAPAFSARHKLQKHEKQPTPAEIWECFLVVFRNQVLSSALQLSIIVLDTFTGRPPTHRFDSTLPSVTEVVREVLLCIFIREIMSYYIHRLVHHPSIYQTVHKPHHSFTPPIALAGQYSGFVEHVLLGIIPIAVPPMLLKSHVVTFWVFLAMELFEVSTVHSGYDFFAGFARRHDLHHEKFGVCFGPTGLMDWIHNTEWKDRESTRPA